MEFNLAKGVLVVDPLEARGIRTRSRTSNIYLLFQIDTTVYRSRHVPAVASGHRWREDSQCRFDIRPGVNPVLKVFAMEEASPLPICLAKGELNLIDIFYEKKSDRWVKLSPLGQLDLELTFYEAAPLMPIKGQQSHKNSSVADRTTQFSNGEVQPPLPPRDEEASQSPSKKEGTKAEQVVSSVDKVFVDDTEEERSRLKGLARKMKRRYKDSISKMNTHHYEQNYRRKSSTVLLENEVQASEVKDLPPVPHSGLDREAEESPATPSSIDTCFSRAPVDLSSLTLDDDVSVFDVNDLPFSASSVGGGGGGGQQQMAPQRLDILRKQHQEERVRNTEYIPVAPESYAVIDRVQKGVIKPDDLKVEGGASEYNGDGTWQKGRLRDSFPTGDAPKLPPKIPVGLKGEEFFVLYKNECLDYLKGGTLLV